MTVTRGPKNVICNAGPLALRQERRRPVNERLLVDPTLTSSSIGVLPLWQGQSSSLPSKMTRQVSDVRCYVFRSQLHVEGACLYCGQDGAR